MPDVLAITGPIFLAGLLGFIATRVGLFAKADMRVLGKFVVNIALPALIFSALSQRPLGDVLDGGYLLAYLAGSLTLLGAGYAWGRRVAKLDPAGGSVVAMGMSCANTGFIGYPILLLALPSVAGVVLALNMVVENLVLIPLVLMLAERGRGGRGRWYIVAGTSLARFAANPLLIAIAGGLVVSTLGWRLPAPVVRTVDLFASSCSALSLFVIGGTLVALPMRGLGRQVVPIAVGKLILHPLAVGFAVFALPALGLPALEPSMRVAAVLSAAVPMMGIYTIFAQTWGHENVGAAAMLVATVASFFTLSGLLWVFANHPGVF